MRILIVDDETMMVDAITIGLGSKGYRTIGVYNAQQALNQLHRGEHRIDLVITDYLMPITNGIDLLKAIRKNYRALPVIIMTAYADANLVIEALKIGCTGFMEKPFSLDQLIVEINRVA